METEWRPKAALVLFSTGLAIIIAVAGCELLIRVTQPFTTPDTERSKSLMSEATLFARSAFPQAPQSAQHVPGIETRINERGYRGRSFAVPKPSDRIRVMVLGGSAAFDMYATEGSDWPTLVEQKLHAVGLGNVEVINAAKPATATWDSLGLLFSELWMFEPDFVLIYEAWNDIKYFSWLTPTHSLLRGYRPPPVHQEGNLNLVWNPFNQYSGSLDRFLSHSQLYIRLRSRYYWWRLGRIGPEGLLVARGSNKQSASETAYPDTFSAWGPKQYELTLRLIATTARAVGAVPVFLTQARLASSSNSDEERRKILLAYVGMSYTALLRAFAECDKALLHAAQAEGVNALDLSETFSGRSELFVDHVHTSTAGSQAIARAVADFLAPLLMEKQRS